MALIVFLVCIGCVSVRSQGGPMVPVPADLGGAGFEEMASELGFTTWTPTEEDRELLDYNVWKGGSITTSVSQFPLSFRPFFFGPNANFLENSYLGSLVYETLLKVHPVTLGFVPSLASHWKIADDGLTFTFRIDPDARWSDGTLVTARDVVSTYDLIMDETLRSPALRASYARYSRPVALSPYLVQLTCDERNWRTFFTFACGLMILQANQIDSLTGGEFVDRFQFESPIGSGPYVVDRNNINVYRSFAFTRRPDWWQADALFNRVQMNFDTINCMVVVDNQSVEYEHFLKQQTDFFTYSSLTTDKWVGDTLKAPFTNNWIRRYRVYTEGPGGTYGYFFNTRRPPFDDVRVRKAMTHLLDRRAIIHDLLFDEYVPYDSWYYNTEYAHPGNEEMAYDPEQAAALLAEAGWSSRDSNGILVRDGKPFVVELKVVYPLVRYVRPFQAAARAAGIDLQIEYVDGNAMSEAMMTRSFEITVGNYGGLVFPNPETSLSSSLAHRPYTNNVTGIADERLDQLIDSYRISFDQKERVRIMQQIDSTVSSQHLIAHWWQPKGIRIAAWDRFGFPPGMLSRITQRGDQELDIFTYWWVDPRKQQLLQDAINNGESLEGLPEIRVVDYWKRRSSRP